MYKCEVEARRVYGNVLYYPINDKAHALTKLLNCKTLTKIQLSRIKDVGFEIGVYIINNGNAMLAPDNLQVN